MQLAVLVNVKLFFLFKSVLKPLGTELEFSLLNFPIYCSIANSFSLLRLWILYFIKQRANCRSLIISLLWEVCTTSMNYRALLPFAQLSALQPVVWRHFAFVSPLFCLPEKNLQLPQTKTKLKPCWLEADVSLSGNFLPQKQLWDALLGNNALCCKPQMFGGVVMLSSTKWLSSWTGWSWKVCSNRTVLSVDQPVAVWLLIALRSSFGISTIAWRLVLLPFSSPPLVGSVRMIYKSHIQLMAQVVKKCL